jgi:hypothetical protein
VDASYIAYNLNGCGVGTPHRFLINDPKSVVIFFGLYTHVYYLI